MKLKNLPSIVFLVALSHFAVELSENFLPIIYPVLIPIMGLTYAQVGLLTLIGSTGSTLFQPIFGYLSDRWGATRIMVISVLWTGVVMGLVGLTTNYWLLAILIGGGMLGSSAFHPAGVAAISANISARRRGSTISIFSVFGSLGTAASPLLITTAIGAVGLPGTTILTPIGLVIGGFLFWKMWKLPGKKPAAAPDIVADIRIESAAPAGNGSKMALALVVLMVMCRSWFQGSVNTYLPQWLQLQGYSLASAGQIFSAVLVATSIGTVIGGTLSDRVGRWQVVGTGLILLSPAMWVFLNTTGAAQIGTAMLIGALLGSSFPVTVAMAAETWPKGVGLASALVMGLGWMPGGIGASFTGYLADNTTLTNGLTWLMVAPVVGVGFVIAFALQQRRQQGMEAVG